MGLVVSEEVLNFILTVQLCEEPLLSVDGATHAAVAWSCQIRDRYVSLGTGIQRVVCHLTDIFDKFVRFRGGES